MFRNLKFALTYALRNMRRDRQRTLFALFSIAAGVATVVALRMLGLMLTDALTSNIQAFLRADIVVSTNVRAPTISILDSGDRQIPITPTNLASIEQWAQGNDIQITYSLSSELMQTAIVKENKAGRPAFILGYFVDPKVYPFYDTIRAQEPAGVPLAQLLTGPDQVVVARRVADQLGIRVGDTLRVGTAEKLQTVTGIVPDSSENNIDNPFSLMFSFVYLDRAYADTFSVMPNAADKAYLKLPPDTDGQAVANRIGREWPRAVSGARWRAQSTQAVLRNNQLIADLMSRFVLLLSLVALVIGGVGIVNTMLVSVNRRASEIAVLKTLGLQGRGVAALFLVESLIWGVVGGLLGLVLGVLLSGVARSMGEQAFGIALPWRIYPEPLALGLGLGIGITALFSLLPTLIAGQVRPNLVLRQTIPLMRAGCLPTAASLLLLVVAFGLLVEAISGGNSVLFASGPPRFQQIGRFPIPFGFLATLILFGFIGLILGAMWLLVWLLGKLPSLRNPNLRLAIRGLTLHRGRTALSLLALIIGMTALSGTMIMGRSINTLLSTSISEPLGGNVIVLPLLPITDVLVRGQLDNSTGVTGYRDVRLDGVQLLGINGDRNFRSKILKGDEGDAELQKEIALDRLGLMAGITVHGNPPRGKLTAGRYLTAEDAGKPRIVIPYSPDLEAIGVGIGSIFTYRINRTLQDFEVIGIVEPDPRTGLIPFSLSDSVVQVPIDMVRRTLPFDLIIANVEKESLNNVMGSVGAVTGVFVFDIGVFDSIIGRLLNQMAALPLLVTGLSLFAAAVLIATTVSLATLERRRQIGILKALGVKRQQALNQLLIENAIVGAVGGIISLLPTVLIIQAVPALTQGLVNLPLPVDLVVILFGLAVGITMGATLLTAWAASGEKPLSALRYE